MATFALDQDQSTNEIHTYTVDFTDDLPSGGTVTGGTATHIPPYGAAGTVTTSVTSPYVYASFPVQNLLGQHYIDVLGTFNNGDKSNVRIPINLLYPPTAARSGLANLLSELRGMTEAGAADYTIAGVPYWSDAQLQDILDIHRRDIIFESLQSYPVQISGGSLSYLDYRSNYKYFEATTGGSAIFYVQDSTGAVVSLSAYTPDYRRGHVQFASNQAGTAYYLTGRSYDVNAAAADIWRRKMAHVAPTSFNFSTDNHSVSRAAVYDHSKEMAEFFEGQSSEAIAMVPMFRSDVD